MFFFSLLDALSTCNILWHVKQAEFPNFWTYQKCCCVVVCGMGFLSRKSWITRIHSGADYNLTTWKLYEISLLLSCKYDFSLWHDKLYSVAHSKLQKLEQETTNRMPQTETRFHIHSICVMMSLFVRYTESKWIRGTLNVLHICIWNIELQSESKLGGRQLGLLCLALHQTWMPCLRFHVT